MSPTRSIGNSTFSAIGFGAMGISAFYGEVESDEDRFKVCAGPFNNWDFNFPRYSTLPTPLDALSGTRLTSTPTQRCSSGNGSSAPNYNSRSMTDDMCVTSIRFKRTGKRADIFLATKCGLVPEFSVNGTPEYMREAAEASLGKLGVESIDLFYLHVRFPTSGTTTLYLA
jgi:aryl-alcohol dehydrogenase-like predicted oxidoreductase